MVTFFVSNFVMLSWVRALQPENMPLISVTFFVSNFVTLILVSAEQPSNILLISVTSEVLRFSIPVICVSAVKKENHLDVVVGRKSLNDGLITAWVIVVFGFKNMAVQAG